MKLKLVLYPLVAIAFFTVPDIVKWGTGLWFADHTANHQLALGEMLRVRSSGDCANASTAESMYLYQSSLDNKSTDWPLYQDWNQWYQAACSSVLSPVQTALRKQTK